MWPSNERAREAKGNASSRRLKVELRAVVLVQQGLLLRFVIFYDQLFS